MTAAAQLVKVIQISEICAILFIFSSSSNNVSDTTFVALFAACFDGAGWEEPSHCV